MKIITALLALNLIAGYFYHFMVVDELKLEISLQKQVVKACTGELLWREMQIEDLKVSR